MFSEISVENFRAFKKISLSDFKKVNLFVGNNNSGKTSLLEALFLSINPVNSSLSAKINDFRRLNIVGESDSWNTLFHMLNVSEKVSITTTLKVPNEKRIIEITPKFDIEVNGSAVYEKGETLSGTTSSASNLVGIKQDLTLIDLDKGKKKKNFHSYIKNKDINKQEIELGKPINPFDSEIDKSYEPSTNGRFLTPENFNKNPISELGKILKAKRKNELLDILRDLEPSLNDIAIIDNRVYCDLGFDEFVPAMIMGDGFLKILSFVLSIMTIEKGILLIDEVENGLFYQNQELLWSYIFKALKKNDVQIFATTHSYDCIQAYISSYDPIEMEGDELRLYRIQKQEDGLFSTTKYDHGELKINMEKGWEIR